MIVLDTGPLVALVNGKDSHHETCRSWFHRVQAEPVVIPAPVLGEAWYLIGKACGAAVEARFLADLAAGAYGQILAPLPDDLTRAGELVGQYADLPLGGTDACVIAIAERLGTATVATLDRRHFGVVRPRHVPAFILLPE